MTYSPNQIKAADLLGLNSNTLRKKISELGVSVYRSSRTASELARGAIKRRRRALMLPTAHPSRRPPPRSGGELSLSEPGHGLYPSRQTKMRCHSTVT
ncbi:hypothetical protein ELI30_09725 [Rhizobium leguminosarum]|nr:hypothetical protein ELI32_10180 [Rhizobium leguminosarum]TAV58063.1 hypothetical protein ELI31_09710 [Rhizobium leguminosarum]TAV69004.1 hypothetical protein ELI30_09725 [Rhizobium leguminosarum]TAY66648.1 hypothetical protein ELH82_10825 [Rhizobium leguminosarum]